MTPQAGEIGLSGDVTTNHALDVPSPFAVKLRLMDIDTDTPVIEALRLARQMIDARLEWGGWDASPMRVIDGKADFAVCPGDDGSFFRVTVEKVA